jgi:hypothetical protein
LGTTIANKNLIQEEIKRILNSCNACYHSAQNILSVFLYGCETWSLTVREEHRLQVFENRALRIFGPKRAVVTVGWRKLYNEELHNLYSSPSIIRMIKSRRIGRVCSMKRGMHIGFWWKSQKEGDH